MEIVKKNIVSVICGVVAVLAIVALFFPFGGMLSEFQTKLDERKKDQDRANTLVKATRYLPVVSLGQTNREKLTVFPNKAVIAEGSRARDAVKQQSAELLTAALQLNKNGHTVLLDGSLPEPGDRVFDFRKAYLQKMQQELPQQLFSVMPPNNEEVAAAAMQIHDKDFEPRVIIVGGKEINRVAIEQEFQERILTLSDELRQERATHYQVYMDHAALSISPAMLDQKKPTAVDVWYAQLGLWIQQDVINSIVSANAIANSTVENGQLVTHNPTILTDPVKRLVKIEIPTGSSVYVTDTSTAGGSPMAPAAAGRPAAAPTGANGDESGGPRDFLQSPTGRISNANFDVVRFTVVLEVDQRQIPLILEELQRSKLLTVQNVNMVPVDTAAAFSFGFVYGNAPIVELTLNCEELFMREWTTLLMPRDVKDRSVDTRK